jgi:DNA mismatch repair protein MutS
MTAAVLADAARDLTGHDALIDLLDQALVAEPPLLDPRRRLYRAGYDADLDETRRLRDEGRGVIAGMQADFIAEDRRHQPEDQAQQRAGLFHRDHGDPCRKDAGPP